MQALQAADSLLTVEISATLAGLTFAAFTFLLTSPLEDLRSKLRKLSTPPPEGQGLKKGDSEFDKADQQIARLTGGARKLYRSFLLFTISLILGLALFDTVLAGFKGNIFYEIAKVVVVGSSFSVGLIYLLAGAKDIKEHYLADNK